MSLPDTLSSRKIALIVCAVIGGGGITGWYLLSDRAEHPTSTALHTPKLAAPAGGENRSALQDAVARQAEKSRADEALRTSKSFASAIVGRNVAPEHVGELGTLPGRDGEAGQKPASSPPAAVPPPPVAQPSQPTSFRQLQSSPDASSAQQEHGSLPLDEAAALYAQWGRGTPASLDMELPGASTGQASSSGPSTNRGGSNFAALPATNSGLAAASAQTPAAPATTTQTPAHRTLLLAAGRGVYGHSVLTSNSDLGSEVLVEIDSGPFRKARVSGTLTLKNDRLVIKFTKLMIGDDDPIAISGYAVTPDTAETGVASEVREHIASRIILPIAAGFIEGLGEAMQNTNTSSYTNASGMSTFTHLNLAQQLGVAAGKGAQAAGQVIQKQTPQQATVLLNRGDTIGVLFDEPVYGP